MAQVVAPASRVPRLVVVSALAKVTDALLAVARLAERGEAEAVGDAVRALRARHEAMATLVRAPERRAELVGALDAAFGELEAVAHALAVVRDVSPRSCDALVAVGELASSRIVAAALADAGLPAAWLDARELLVTDAAHGGATPDRDRHRRAAARAGAPAAREGPGGRHGRIRRRDASGATTTLGRGGSDYSAALFGAGLEAQEIQIWTDVDGMLTADPRLVASRARREAPELRRGVGARVLRREGAAPEHDPAGRGPRHSRCGS